MQDIVEAEFQGQNQASEEVTGRRGLNPAGRLAIREMLESLAGGTIRRVDSVEANQRTLIAGVARPKKSEAD